MIATIANTTTRATPVTTKTPEEIGGTHYGQGVTTSPWDLQQAMKSSGIVFVDARRTDVIEYCFRVKGDLPKMREDLSKAQHNLHEAIKRLDLEIQEANKDRKDGPPSSEVLDGPKSLLPRGPLVQFLKI